MSKGYCPQHEDDFSNSNVNRMFLDLAIISEAFRIGLITLKSEQAPVGEQTSVEICWACQLSEDKLAELKKRAAEMEANVLAFGGNITTPTLAVRSGQDDKIHSEISKKDSN